MTKNRFLRIVQEIQNGVVEKKKDRDDFIRLVSEYRENEDEEYFFGFRNKEVGYINNKLFDEFVKYYLGGFTKRADSKKEAIEKNKNSKKGSLHTTKNLIIHRKKYQKPALYYKEFPETFHNIVAVENFESFLKVDFDLFDEEDFVYLGGFSNNLIREFLKERNVLFFVDFDFFGIEIYNSIECKSKKFFVPDNLEELLKEKGSVELYKKQLFKRDTLKVDDNTKEIFELINKYSKCLEQEVLDVD